MARPSVEELRTEMKDLREAYRRLFRTTDGDRVLKDLQEQVEKGRSLRPAEGLPIDPSQAVWNEGARAPIRRITEMLKENGNE